MAEHASTASEPIRFQARWVSGFYRSPAGIRWLRSANRCLTVTVTDEELQIRMMMPFSVLFGPNQWGFKQNIPLSEIKQVEKSRFCGWWNTVRVTFTADGQQQCLELCFTGPLPQFGNSQVITRDQFVDILRSPAAAC